MCENFFRPPYLHLIPTTKIYFSSSFPQLTIPILSPVVIVVKMFIEASIKGTSSSHPILFLLSFLFLFPFPVLPPTEPTRQTFVERNENTRKKPWDDYGKL